MVCLLGIQRCCRGSAQSEETNDFRSNGDQSDYKATNWPTGSGHRPAHLDHPPVHRFDDQSKEDQPDQPEIDESEMKHFNQFERIEFHAAESNSYGGHDLNSSSSANLRKASSSFNTHRRKFREFELIRFESKKFKATGFESKKFEPTNLESKTLRRLTHQMPSPMNRIRLCSRRLSGALILFVFLLVARSHADRRSDYYSTNADSSLSYDLKNLKNLADENQSSANQTHSNDSRLSGRSSYSENWSASNQPDESEQLNESELLDQLDLTDQLEQLNAFDKMDIDLGEPASRKLANAPEKSTLDYPLNRVDLRVDSQVDQRADDRTDRANSLNKPPAKKVDERSEIDKLAGEFKANPQDRLERKAKRNQQQEARRGDQPATTPNERHPTEQQAEQPLLDEPKQTRSVQKIPIGKRNLFPFSFLFSCVDVCSEKS